MKQTVYCNGRILTMDDSQPEADYVVTENGRVKAVGKGEAAENLTADDVEWKDLRGRCLMPGFIDSHMHMLTAALNRFKLDISGMQFAALDEMLLFVRREKENVKENWISIFGFSEENIADGRMITRWDIDRFFPDTPVTVHRICGHLSIINSQAMSQLDPAVMESIDGGEFRKDTNGEYNGIATEGAQQYVLDRMPQPDDEAVIHYMQKEQEKLFQYGITGIHDAGTDMIEPRHYVNLYEEINRRGQLKLRTWLMVRPDEGESFESFEQYIREKKTAHKDDERLRIGSVKLFADGSFGSRTAALTEPFEGELDNRGILLEKGILAYAGASADSGHQVAVHAIGDRAVGRVVEVYEAVRKVRSSRLRIEHAELLDDQLIAAIQKNNILVMTQPVFIREFGEMYRSNLGEERVRRIQPIRTLLEKGITVGFGTDYPVDDPNPLVGIYTAMTRKVRGSDLVINKEEGIRFLDAAKCYTTGSARGAFWEDSMGTIREGCFADFVILSGVISDEDGEVRDISRALVEETVIGGKMVFSLSEKNNLC